MVNLILAATLVSATAGAAKPYCGDGAVRGSEECDTTDLDGLSCVALGYDDGELACDADCILDTSACTLLPAAVCGDGLIEGYEECEATADAACPGACSDHCACPATTSGDLEVHVIDVGQGDGVLVISPDGFALLVDAGTGAQDATIAAYLTSIGLSSLDYTLVTHMDADHVGGMDGILSSWPEVVVAFDNGSNPGTLSYSDYDAAAGGRRLTLGTGEFIDLGPSMTCEVMHSQASSNVENNNSNVIKLTYGSNTVLIGGDCESECEASFNPGASQVYKVHHHGSSDASSQSFLDAMQPEVAVISVGDGNQYAHPAQQTLTRLAEVGADIYRTDLDGDVEVVLDGAAYTVNGAAACIEAETRSCGTTDVGSCSLGIETCSGGAWSTCIGEVTAASEDCSNGLDDDCDGLTDTDDTDCVPTSTELRIVQVAYDTPGTDSLEEFIDLYNPTGAPVSLDGWSLSDTAGAWSFPATASIPAGGFMTVARDAGGLEAWLAITPDEDGLSLSLNNGGDVIILADELGVEVDRVAWESAEPGWTASASGGDSIARNDVDVDSDTGADWSTLSPAAPMGGTAYTGGTGSCGDGTCSQGEDCESCPSDCAGVTSGRPSNRFCCGNATCESVGEDADTCPVDCL